MTRTFLRLLMTIGLVFSSLGILYAWGAWGHQHIDRAAVFALPIDMRTFFFNHIDFITEESVIPDIRKYTINDLNEPPRHFIDLEKYGNPPFDSIPTTWELAVKKYGPDSLQKNGILPWYVLSMKDKLTKAFRDRNKDRILFLAADLGHYLGDATQPLHTTIDYDGQQSNQRGIHAFFESQLPELFGDQYHFNIGEARYISNPVSEIWGIVRMSHACIDTVLNTEKQLSRLFPQDSIYQEDESGQILKNSYGAPLHTEWYARLYHKKLNGLIERQLRIAAIETADFWYTAWVDAGKPDLNRLDPPELTSQNAREMEREYQLWLKGKLFGLKSNKEF